MSALSCLAKRIQAALSLPDGGNCFYARRGIFPRIRGSFSTAYSMTSFAISALTLPSQHPTPQYSHFGFRCICLSETGGYFSVACRIFFFSTIALIHLENPDCFVPFIFLQKVFSKPLPNLSLLVQPVPTQFELPFLVYREDNRIFSRSF